MMEVWLTVVLGILGLGIIVSIVLGPWLIVAYGLVKAVRERRDDTIAGGRSA